MKQYQAKNILNLAIAGHSGSGKTSLAEAMLYLAGASDRLGKVTDGNTVLDYDPEEVRPCFRRMRAWFDRLRAEDIPGARMEILSMGMTGDYIVAAEEGATMVRPGRALFGARI